MYLFEIEDKCKDKYDIRKRNHEHILKNIIISKKSILSLKHYIEA